jgi:hypothetical protein
MQAYDNFLNVDFTLLFWTPCEVLGETGRTKWKNRYWIDLFSVDNYRESSYTYFTVGNDFYAVLGTEHAFL